MASNKAIVLSLALTLICFSDLGLSEGRKWKLEKNDFWSMSNTGEYEAAGDEVGDHRYRGVKQPRVVKSPAPAPSEEAYFTPSPSPRHHPGVGHPVHPPMSTHGQYDAMMVKEDKDDHGLLRRRRRPGKKPSRPAPAPMGEYGMGMPRHPPHAPAPTPMGEHGIGMPRQPPHAPAPTPMGEHGIGMPKHPVHPPMSIDGNYEVTMAEEDNDNHGKGKGEHKKKHPPHAPTPAPIGEPAVGHPVHPPMSTNENYGVTMTEDDNDNHGKGGHKKKHPSAPTETPPAPLKP